MIHSLIYLHSDKTSGFNFDHHFHHLFQDNERYGIYKSYEIYPLGLNPNFNILGKGWINKDVPVSYWPVERSTYAGKLIFRFKFGIIRILAIPIMAPGSDHNGRAEILGHFKIIGYQVDEGLKCQYDVKHEAASVYSLLAMSLIYDTYIITAMHQVKFMNFIDMPNDIDITPYVFIIHCPMLNEFKLFAHLHTYKLNWSKDVFEAKFLDIVHVTYDYNLQGYDGLSYIRENNHVLSVYKSGNNPNYPLSDYNSDIKEDYLYTELAEILRPGVENIWNINFIKNPKALRDKIEQSLKEINNNLKNKDKELITTKLKFMGRPGMSILSIINHYNFLFDIKQDNFYTLGPVKEKAIEIVRSVEAWNFNLVLPIYFYYGENLAKHILDGIEFFESVIGPYTFILHPLFKKQIEEAVKSWPWTTEAYKVEDIMTSMFQLYFLLLCLTSNDKIIADNLKNPYLNSYTVDENRQVLKNKLKELFNATISKSTIMEDIYVLDNMVVYDPVINKILAISNSLNKEENLMLDLQDAIYVLHNLKLYNITFRQFLANLLNHYELDPYIKE